MTYATSDFHLSSEQCRLLLTLEEAGTLEETARRMGRDLSVISRNVSKLAERAPVVEKRNGKWHVSEIGKKLNSWSRDAILEQSRILSERASIRVATTREFAARILSPALASLFPDPKLLVTVLASESGVERLLLEGEADLGFDCGRPSDPAVKFERVIPEPFVIVAAPRFIPKSVRTIRELTQLPSLEHTRLPLVRAMNLAHPLPAVRAVFNDVASIREACCAGLGWTLLPRYSVEREMAENKLKEFKLEGLNLYSESFGVWWLRDRKAILPWVECASKWLKEQRL